MTDPSGTLPETAPHGGTPESADLLGLAIAWSAEEPGRIGEVALIPGGSEGGPVQILGRGGAARNDAHARLSFSHIRGSRIETRPPLAMQRLSRLQLRVRAVGDGNLEVENLGRLRLENNGAPCQRALVRPGDLLQLGGQVLFLVVQRRLVPSAHPESCPPGFPFGFADRCGLVGESPLAWALRERIAFVGPRRGHVLILGASGVGKELVARAVHAASDRAGRALCARNAATLPEGIVDAELFGNARNYPNPGVGERAGLIGDADGTSLFLDEFGELAPSAQAHLLRVLDGGEYQRLGESRMRVSTFRLIAATNRPLSVLKDDVLARLAFRIDVADLNARKEDVPLLARHLLCRILSTDEALARRFRTADRVTAVPSLSLRFVRELLSREYVSHARELEGILWRALETSGSGVIEPPPHELASIEAQAVARQGADGTLSAGGGAEDDRGATIQRCLDANNGALEPTWRELGLSSRHALARLIRKHGLEVRKRATT